MNPAPLNRSQRGLYAVYAAASIIVCSIAVALHLSVPIEVADYVSNGLMLPAFRYGLLFSLIACGVILSGEDHPIALAVHLAIFASALWLGLRRVEPIVLSYPPLADLIARYPVDSSVMSMTTGGALLLPRRARRWLVPLVCAICGLGLGVFVILESPLDYYDNWFSSAGGLGGTAVVVASIAFANGARQICAGSWLAVAGRIFGSWLIAASLLLAALALVAKPPVEPAPVPTAIPDAVEP